MATPRWPRARLAVADTLWGEGFTGPGGAQEVMRLATPLGVTSAASVLLLGAASGGPPRVLATAFGGWISGFEVDPDLVDLATERLTRAGLARRAPVSQRSPHAPIFRQAYFHHALAFEPLRGARPELALGALAQGLKPGGQLILTELVADMDTPAGDPVMGAWTSRDGRQSNMPTEVAITGTLARLGFDVRVVEDVSARHTATAIDGWQNLVSSLAGRRPGVAEVAAVVSEAEVWLLRLRLIRSGRMRLVRWHAIAQA